MAAAVSARRRGSEVLICEKTPRIGRKVLASGNGRCNLANDNLDSSFYNIAARPITHSAFSRHGIDDIKRFFEGMGLALRSDSGRIFPVTDQASSVLKVFELEMSRLSIPVETEFDVSKIAVNKVHGGFTLSSSSNRSVIAGKVIVACGGKSYPAFGSDGSGYRLAETLGHSIVEPVPAAVPLAAKDPLCHMLQGQKVPAAATAVICGKKRVTATGDVLFTKYGLSGTAILDISECLSIAINREAEKDTNVSIDMAPFMDERGLAGEFAKRTAMKARPEDMAAGILPNKLCIALKEIFRSKSPSMAASLIKNRLFRIIGTRGWNEADFTAGGVGLTGIDPATMESKIVKGVYFAGEILDVNGERGGYNLAWAWASGMIAGESAADA